MVVAFKDKHPASTVHLLIVPKYSAVRSPAYLTVQHVDLLEHMVSNEATWWAVVCGVHAMMPRSIMGLSTTSDGSSARVLVSAE